MKTILHILIFGLWLIFAASLHAQHFEFNGFMDSYHAIRLNPPHDFMSSRSRLRAELKGSKGPSSFFTSMNANHNYLLPDRSFIELREAYLDYAAASWDIRAGRQILIWGVADGIRITDIIAPMDFTEFLARDYDDIRMPVDALRLRAFRNNLKLELIFIPVFQSFIYPTEDKNPWSILPRSPNGPEVVLNEALAPEARIRNSEFGGRFSLYLSGIDLSLSSLYTWNKMPVFRTSLSAGQDTLFMHPEHHRLWMNGFDLSKTLGSLVTRVEGAFLMGEYYPSEMNGFSNHLIKKEVIRYLIGLDWYPGGEWTLTGQCSHACILNGSEGLDGRQHSLLATLGISKKLFQSTLSLSTFGYVDIINEGYFNRTSLDYSLSDQIHLFAGVDLFGGDAGMFGIYQNNSEVWIKFKYSF